MEQVPPENPQRDSEAAVAQTPQKPRSFGLKRFFKSSSPKSGTKTVASFEVIPPSPSPKAPGADLPPKSLTSSADVTVETPADFQALEKSTFISLRSENLLACPSCSSSDLRNHGAGGDPNQFGVRLIQVACKECNTRHRLADVLRFTDREAEASMLEGHMHSLAPRAAPKKRKQLRAPIAPPPAPAPNPVEAQLAAENAALKAQLQDLHRLLLESMAGQAALRDDVRKLTEALRLQLIENSSKNPKKSKKNQKEPTETDPATLPDGQDQLHDHPAPIQVEPQPAARVEVEAAPPARPYRDAAAAPAANPRNQRRAPPTRRVLHRWAKEMANPVKPPTDFVRIHVRIPNSRRLAKCPRSGRTNLLRDFLRTTRINTKVVLFSAIGNSLLELYVPAPSLEEVTEILAGQDIEVLTDLDILAPPTHARLLDVTTKVVNRLAFLFRRANSVSVRRAILGGLAAEVSEAVEAAAAAADAQKDPGPRALAAVAPAAAQ